MVWTSIWTMTMSPVALGQQAKQVTKSEMQAALDQMGLNKQMTLGEFYKKNKYLFPERIRKEIEPMFMANKNMMMPSFEVISSKTTSGEEIPTVRMSQGGELINLQWFGEKDRLLKFQNTNLSEIDVINFDDMYTRIIAGDERFRKQVEPKVPLKKDSAKIPAKVLPDITTAEWKSMSAYQRANYVVNMRTLWQDARAVLNAKKSNTKAKPKKTSQHIFEQHPYFAALFYTPVAEANGAAKVVVSQTRTESRTEYTFTGNTCIVAGYVAKYETVTSAQVCNHTVADKAYAQKDNSLYLKAKEVCARDSGKIACNPYVYGAPGGSPTCVNPSRTDDSFQRATHYDGPCDTASRLQSSPAEVEILKDKAKTNGRYEDGNLLSEQERRELFKTEQGKENYKLTEDYLLGILKFRGVVKSDAKGLFETEVMNDEILKQIKIDKQAFDSEIREALASCKAESEASKAKPVTHEKNYWQACDQLHRRHTFIKELFESKCESKSLNEDTLKCKCTTPGTNEVLPGAKCAAVNPPAVIPAPVSADVTPAVAPPSADVTESKKSCEERYPGAGVSEPSCLCPNGQAPTNDATDGASGMQSWSCASKPNKPSKKEDECGVLCKIWKGVKIAAPFVIAGAVAYGLYKLLAPKKPTLNAPTDKCPDGSIPPCGQVCTPPLKKQSNGTCSCDGCPPGQTANAVTCTCSTGTGTGTGTGTTYLCPDGQTRKANLDECPTYACWNGQSYQNPMNCPTQVPNTNGSTGTGTGTR